MRNYHTMHSVLYIIPIITLICTANAASDSPKQIVVVGSVNVDLIVPVHRLPTLGETITGRAISNNVAVGGKGANQAVAAARLSSSHHPCRFIGRFGHDAYASLLENTLLDAGVDISGSGRALNGIPSGQGIVLLDANGTASSVVLSGANDSGWTDKELKMDHIIRDGSSVVMLQQEVPERVNIAVAAAAKKKSDSVVMLDIGGEDRPIPNSLLKLIDYLCPNESELKRLTGMMDIQTDDDVINAAKALTSRGASNVLVTLAERGAILVMSNGTVFKQDALPIPGGKVVDGTAAGDAFRAGFAVGIADGRSIQECLRFAAAAGALVVSKLGAVPSLPYRDEVLALSRLETPEHMKPVVSFSPGNKTDDRIDHSPKNDVTLRFASRLNSMKSRRDLVGRKESNRLEQKNNVLGWIARQGRINGLDLIDFNYPEHFEGVTVKQITSALSIAGLKTGAIAIRFPEEFRLGAFTNPDEKLREKAIQTAVKGANIARDLGAKDLIIWSPFDGYDYNFQVDYVMAWQNTVHSFRKVADLCPPGVRVSLEFKPTDESTRFSIVPSTGAALMLVKDVDRPNFGLTLDVGHMLAAGENPAQSVAMVGTAGKLFGMQLNDAHIKLGAEDGLAFGSVNSVMALELVYWLRRVNYDGHVYYDTFPRNEDPVREAEYNIRRFKSLWARADLLAEAGIQSFMEKHDAMGVLETLEKIETVDSMMSCRSTATDV